MKKTAAVIILLASCVLPFPSIADRQGEDHKPSLTILISLDQFGAGLLEKYNPALEAGFRRMIDKGAWFRNATVDHAPTLSLPGHTTLATGANPKTHGITANAWLDPRKKPDENQKYKVIVPYVDPSVRMVGDENARAFSPHHIRVEGIANWFRKSDPDARTVALSVTPIAVLYGGQFEEQNDDHHVYWLGLTGRFQTSSYYRDNYPGWITRFNEGIAEKYTKNHVWENTVPVKFQSLAREDQAKFEYDGVHTAFPHKADDIIREVNQDNYNWWLGRFSPYQNEALFDLAEVAIDRLQLGQRDSVDFLSIAVKLTDRIGHDFGPGSLEQLDVILRLDRLLGAFFQYLDATVGEGNYLVALSSDHGSPAVSEYEISQGRAALRISSEDFEAALKSVETLVNGYAGDEQELPGLIAGNLEQFPFIAKAMTREDLQAGDDDDPVVHAYRNSYLVDQTTTYPLWTRSNMYGNLVGASHPARFGVVVEIAENSNIWAARSTHGSAYSYDRKVPILMMGPGIEAGSIKQDAHTRDVAPTLAALSGVKYPETVDGIVLKGAVNR